MARKVGAVRAIALAGPTGAGKTSLAQALIVASGEGEVRPPGPATELAIHALDFMNDRYALIDAPGSVEFAADLDYALPAVDFALVVIDPDPEKAALAQPYLKQLERLGIPRALFVNKIEQARGRIRDLLDALQPMSQAALVARQIPIWRDERVTGFIDLALERAFIYRSGEPSLRVAIPNEIAGRETEARFHMLEQLADFDDALMEQLLSDMTPSRDEVFRDLVRETHEGLIAPVFFGSASQGFGVRRLLKALRHDVPTPERAAARLRLKAPGAYVMKISHAGQAGKLAYSRALAGGISDGAELSLADGAKARANGLLAVNGGTTKRTTSAAEGEVVAIGKIEALASGDILSANGPVTAAGPQPEARFPVYQLAIATKDRKDDVRLSVALAKLLEEDRGLGVHHDAVTHETLLRGQGEAHLRAAIERLKKRFSVDVTSERPITPYKESIRKPVTQRGRHKKQTGGHGQFGDVVVDIKPLARGEGLQFHDKITGGVVPKQWIPAVEQGVRDATEHGPLGFPVVDVAVTLTDGSYHSVDSSELAFRMAGRAAMSDGLKACEPYLLEPIEKLTIYAPSSATSKVNSMVSGRHGQILGFTGRDGWTGWDRIEVYLPHAERQDFILELRGLTQGLGSFEASFDHMVEMSGRRADDAVKRNVAA